MARTFTIKDSSTTLNLIDPSAPGIIAQRGGFGTRQYEPAIVDKAKSIEDLVIPERWKLYTIGTTHANMVTEARELIELLRNAWRYWNEEDFKDPVYITQQVTGESAARYALVYTSEIMDPDYFDIDAELNYILNQGVVIGRLPWTSTIPGTLPTAITQESVNGPTSTGTKKPIVNEISDLTLTHLYNYDANLTAFSSNFYNTASFTLWEVSGSTPAAGDCIYFGCSTQRAIHNLVFNIGTPANANASISLQYYNGSWTNITYGDDWSLYVDAYNWGIMFSVAGEWWLNISPPEDAIATTINGVNAYWYRLVLNSVTSWTTSPTHTSVVPWNFVKNYIQVSNARILGDAPPITSLRLWAPYSGDQNPSMASLTQIIMGLKSDPGTFDSHINLNGNGVPSGWAETLGTDASALTTPEGPRGEAVAVDFAGDETLTNRVALTGTGKLADWKGRYRAFIRAQQIGGAAGDISLRLRSFIDASNVYSPQWDTPIVALKTMDEGPELVSLGELKVPFIDYAKADTFTNANLIFNIQAKRDTGAGTLRLYDLILIPADEWTSTLYALIADTTNAPEALRSSNVIEDDGGIIANRTIKYFDDAGTLYPAQEWGRGGIPLKLPIATEFRIYFLMVHKPLGGAWSDNYLMSYPGTMLKAQIYSVPYYLGLTG